MIPFGPEAIHRERCFEGARLGAAALLLSGDSSRADRMANLFEVAAGFSAKEACSCAVVAEQTEELCQAFGQVPGLALQVEVTVDGGARTVTRDLSGISRTARATPGAGCALDPLP